MKRTAVALIAAGVLSLGLPAGAYAQTNTDAAATGQGVSPSPGSMPNRTPTGTTNVNPANNEPMGGGKNSEQRLNTQK
jgi:hypothetical protein